MSTGFGRRMRGHWMLDPAITYLNHGTVGATPRRVLERQQALRDEAERCPARWQLRELADVKEVPMRMEPRMRTAAREVAAFVGARGDDLVFVDNATFGVNAVLGSLALRPGDEILLSDHVYGSILRIARHFAGRAGATVRTWELPWPRWDDDEAIVAAFAAALGPRTRLAVVEHVSSSSATVFPVAAMVARAKAAGVPVLLDGAHAPGMFALDVPSLGADWYTANLHKWAMAPRSAGFLWAPPGGQQDLHPPVISWGYGHGFAAEFDLLGTRDASASLAAPEGLAFMRDLGLEAMWAWNHRLAWESACRLAERWGQTLPVREAQVGSMVTLPMPERFGRDADAIQRLKDALLYEDGIEVQMHAWKGRGWLRLCGQVYVEAADVDRLAHAMEART